MTLDVSELQVSVEEEAAWRRTMHVTVPASIVQAEEQRAASKLASRARLKGFRKGRVPARVIESRFGGALRQEALDKLVNEASREALAAQALRPISDIEVEAQHFRYEPNEDLSFAISFDVEPVFEVERVGGFVVQRPSSDVDDAQVDAVLARIQEQNGVWRPLEEGLPEDKDLVSVKITRLGEDDEPIDEARDYELIVAQGDALPDIEAAIRTLEPGQTNDFDIHFPEDFADESRRGEKDRVRIQLESRRTLDVPDLDDDLAKQVGDFDTLEELTARVREDLQKEAAQQAESAVRSQLIDHVVDANDFEVPRSMIHRYTDGLLGNAQELPEEQLHELRERIRPEAERAVKRFLMIDRIAEHHGLAADDDAIDGRIEEIASANNTEPAKVYAELQKAGRLETIERELTEDAVFAFLTEQSEITDQPGT